MSAMFYKKTKISQEVWKESMEDGEKTGCETGGASAQDQSQQHMADIRDFIDFEDDDSEDDADMDKEEKIESDVSSATSEWSDSEDEGHIKERKPVNAVIRARLDLVRYLTSTHICYRNQEKPAI